MKSEFKFKNMYNMTEDEIEDMPVTVKINDKPVIVGVLTHIEDDYVYGVFNHDGEEYMMVELNNNEYSWSIELNEDK